MTSTKEGAPATEEHDAELAAVLGLARGQVVVVRATATGWTVQVQSPRLVACPASGSTRCHRHGALRPRVVAHPWVADGLVQAARRGWRPWQRWSPPAQQAALQRLRRDSVRGAATVLSVGVSRLRHLVDIRVQLDDDTGRAYPGGPGAVD